MYKKKLECRKTTDYTKSERDSNSHSAILFYLDTLDKELVSVKTTEWRENWNESSLMPIDR